MGSDFKPKDDSPEAQQEAAAKKNNVMSAFANVGDNLASGNSFGNYWLGQVNKKQTTQADAEKERQKQDDPMARQEKVAAYLKQKRELAQMQAADDPMHSDATTYRTQMEELAPMLKGKLDGMTLEQMQRTSPIIMARLKGIQDERMARIAAGEKNAARKDVQDAKFAEKEEKKKTSTNEVAERKRNIEDNLSLLEKQIKDKGTYEMFGSHNADLDRRVEAIATDMAKLADPSSVARPAEVEAFKKGLVQSNAMSMSNDTALDVLKNFRGEVGSRAANAYKVRGLDVPQGEKTIVKKQQNQKTGEIRVVYSDGTAEIIPSTAGR